MEKLFYLNPAENKDEALPLGNGRIGAMLYGGVSEDVYTLNDDTLCVIPAYSAYLTIMTQIC